MVLIVHVGNRLADDFFSLHEPVICAGCHALFVLGCHDNLELWVIMGYCFVVSGWGHPGICGIAKDSSRIAV